MPDETTKPKPDLGWAIVEIMGHNRYAGYCTEETVAGSAFLRVDVPGCEEQAAFTKLFGSSAIYCISPCTEEVARSQAPTLIREANRLSIPDEWRTLMQAGERAQRAERLLVNAAAPPPSDDEPSYDPDDDDDEY